MSKFCLYGYGDSNMWGWDPHFGVKDNRLPEKDIWLNRVSEKMDCCVINDSLPGRKIPLKRALPLFLSSVGSVQWDVIILMLGVNDLMSLSNPVMERIAERWIPALGALTEKYPEKKDRIILASMTPFPASGIFDINQKVSRGYKRVAEQFGVQFFDTLALNLHLTYDVMHLSEYGHEMLADAVCDYLAGMDLG